MSTRPEAVPSNEVARREPLPGSRKVYVPGPGGSAVPFREIALHSTKGIRGVPRELSPGPGLYGEPVLKLSPAKTIEFRNITS